MKRNLEAIFIYNSCMLKNVLTKDLNIKRILNLHYVIQNRHGFGMLMVKAQFSRVCPGGLDPCHIFLAHLHLDKCGYLKSLAWSSPPGETLEDPGLKDSILHLGLAVYCVIHPLTEFRICLTLFKFSRNRMGAVCVTLCIKRATFMKHDEYERCWCCMP